MAATAESEGWTHDEFLEDVMRRLACSQIAFECGLGLTAAQHLEAALTRGNDVEAWLAIRGVFVCAANVAKMLWPRPKDKSLKHALEARGTQLQSDFEVEDSSPLHKRDVRDGFEHIEERLDRSVKKTGHFADLVIGPTDTFNAQTVMLRHYDPQTGQIRVLDATANLRDIIRELEVLRPKAQAKSLIK